MSGSGLISSDSHVVEPPDLWTRRIDARFRERAPRVVSEPGGDWWYIDGKRSMSFLGVQTGDRFRKDATELIISARFEQVRPAAHDPHAFVAENLQDGVAGSVLYPSEGLLAYGIPDSELCSAVMAAYNDFIAEFCAAEPRHLRGIALVNVDDPALAVRELERCRGLGLVGAMISVLPAADRPYDLPIYEPLWSAAVDFGMPLAMHVATGRSAASVDVHQQGVTRVSPSAFYLQDHFVRACPTKRVGSPSFHHQGVLFHAGDGAIAKLIVVAQEVRPPGIVAHHGNPAAVDIACDPLQLDLTHQSAGHPGLCALGHQVHGLAFPLDLDRAERVTLLAAGWSRRAGLPGLWGGLGLLLRSGLLTRCSGLAGSLRSGLRLRERTLRVREHNRCHQNPPNNPGSHDSPPILTGQADPERQARLHPSAALAY